MSIGLFTDKNRKPTDAEVAEAIGPMLPCWDALIETIRDTYPSQEDFKYLYGQSYGWALRFRIRGKLLTNMYPTRNGFTVQVNLSPAAVDKAELMSLGESVRGAIASATAYPEGKWLFVPVRTDDDVRDIHQLLALRVDKDLSKKA